jgi:hypothetical protein
MAHTIAEAILAIWNCNLGISAIPAASGTMERSGPLKRPTRTAAAPAEQIIGPRQQRGMAGEWPHPGDRILEPEPRGIGNPVAKHRADTHGEHHGPERDAPARYKPADRQ